MVIGIFAGTGFEVEAAGGLYYEEFDPPENYDDLKEKFIYLNDLTCNEVMQYFSYYGSNNYPEGVIVDVCNYNLKVSIVENTPKSSVTHVYVKDQSEYDALKNKYSNTDTKWYIAKQISNQPVSGKFVEITDGESIDKLEKFAPDAPYNIVQDVWKSNYPDDAYFVLGLWNGNVMYGEKVNPSGTGVSMVQVKQELKQALADKKQVYIWVSDALSTSETTSQGESGPHTHSYSWVTVQDVNSEQDGIEEYRCSCGDVQERCVIPRYMAIVKGLYGAVKDAPKNGTATFDTGSAFTMTDYVIRKLSERTDVTTVITFQYQNQSYRMTIPAGADYTELLSDEDYFYGYFFFANAVGATIEMI